MQLYIVYIAHIRACTLITSIMQIRFWKIQGNSFFTQLSVWVWILNFVFKSSVCGVKVDLPYWTGTVPVWVDPCGTPGRVAWTSSSCVSNSVEPAGPLMQTECRGNRKKGDETEGEDIAEGMMEWLGGEKGDSVLKDTLSSSTLGVINCLN